MKHCFTLLLLSTLCLLSLSVPGDYPISDNANESVSPITTFHELWGIPWGVSYEEFSEKVRERYEIEFLPWKANDSSPNDSSDLVLPLEFPSEVPYKRRDFPVIYTASADNPIFLFGFPVEITAYNGLSWERWELGAIEIDFNYTATIYTTEIAFFITEEVFNALTSRYGAPTHAYVYPYRKSTDNEVFALPLHDDKLELVEVVEKAGLYAPIFAHFGNVVFSSVPVYVTPPGLEMRHLSIYIVSPDEKNDPRVIPPKEILPWDEINVFLETRPTPRPTIDRTMRIDIGL